jgi:plastocyanin
MRFKRGLLAIAAVAFLACRGADKPAAETPAKPDTTAPVSGAGPTTITGKTHTVNMIGDDKGYRFDPADITIEAGDVIKFIMVSGGPHSVAFDPATIPAAAKVALTANMPNQQSELSGPFISQPNDAYTISFNNVPPGAYPYFCPPHLAFNMKGTITVR